MNVVGGGKWGLWVGAVEGCCGEVRVGGVE